MFRKQKIHITAIVQISVLEIARHHAPHRLKCRCRKQVDEKEAAEDCWLKLAAQPSNGKVTMIDLQSAPDRDSVKENFLDLMLLSF